MYFLNEIVNRHLERENRRLSKENDQLTDEKRQLQHELDRARLQLQQLLRVKKTRKGRSAQESETGSADLQKKKRKKKRGAPPGHPGQTRPIPDAVDEVRTIDPPRHCPHCGSSHIISGNEYYSVFQEDIPPIKSKSPVKAGKE